MARPFTESQLVLASHNQGKLKEIAALVVPFGVTVTSAGALGLPEPDETGASYIENAVIKALASATASGLPALADDSGVAVTALDGAPGIYSARWAGPAKDFKMAMARVNELLADNPDRSGYFVCALALAWPDGHCETFEGRIDGTLVWPMRGTQGFGYDPMFQPVGETRTFGEMSPAEKKAISHRAKAFALLVDGLLKE